MKKLFLLMCTLTMIVGISNAQGGRKIKILDLGSYPVYIDGELQGRTNQDIWVTYGTHEIIVQRGEQRFFGRTINVGNEYSFDFSMAPRVSSPIASNNTSTSSQSTTLTPQRDPKKNLYGYFGVKKNGKSGFIIKPKFENASAFYRDYAFVKNKNLWGIIDAHGKYIVEPQFSNVIFNDKKNRQRYFEVCQNEKRGILDIKSCKIVVPIKYSQFKYTKGKNLFAQENGKWFLVNILSGQHISETQYDNISSVRNFYIVTKDSKYGIVSQKGKVISEPIYDDISIADETCSTDNQKFYIVTKDGKYGIISRKGAIVSRPIYDDISNSTHESVKIVKQAGKYGFVDITNGKVCPCSYEAILSPLDQSDLIVVQNGTKQGVVNMKNLTEILPCKYDKLEKTNYDLLVCKQDDNYGIAKTNGEILIPTTINKTQGGKLAQNILADKPFAIPTKDGKCYVLEKGRVSTLSEYAANNAAGKEYPIIRDTKAFDSFRKWSGWLEETINGQIYSHEYICGLENEQQIFAAVKHAIDNKRYLYRHNKSDKTMQKFCFEDLFEIDGDFSLVSMGKLSNGDYLIETSSVRTIFLGNLFPGYEKYVKSWGEYVYFMKRDVVFTTTSTTKYLIIVDGKTFRPKRVALHPGDSTLFGISNDDGWYMMGIDSHYERSWVPEFNRTVTYYDNRTISKYSNIGEVEWFYSAPDGEGVSRIYETPAYAIMSGWTKNKGYIGFKNPLLVHLDINTGNREHEQHITKKASFARLDKYILHKSLAYQKEATVVKYQILGTTAYGLQDQNGNWLIKPVVIGGESQSCNGFTILPPRIDANGNIVNDITKCVINPNNNEFSIKVININDAYHVGDIVNINGVWGVVSNIEDTGRHGTIMALQTTEKKLDWLEANNWCSTLGGAWRLPTKKEWEAIYNNRETIILMLSANTLDRGSYWSSTAYDNDKVYVLDFFNGGWNDCYTSSSYSVRAVLAF